MRTHRSLTRFTSLLIALFLSPALLAEEVFTFDTVSDGRGFDGQINAPSASGDVFLKTASRTAVQEDNGRIFLYLKNQNKPDDAVLPLSATLNVVDRDGNALDFTVSSLKWRSVHGKATLVGMRDGKEVWRLDDTFNQIDPIQTVNTATEGEMSKPVDALVWEFKTYVNGTFGSAIDDLQIEVASSGD
ncbi:MAG: hypothetical protein AAF797_01490 [Planctomycetota bacterium]